MIRRQQGSRQSAIITIIAINDAVDPQQREDPGRRRKKAKAPRPETPPLHKRKGDSVPDRPASRQQVGNPERTPCDIV